MAAVNRLLALACAGGLALALGGCREEEAPAAFDTGIAFSQAESLPAGSAATVWFLTDLHLLAPSLTDYGPDFQALIDRGDGKATHYSDEIVASVAAEIARLPEAERPDAVIAAGDLTLNGELESHRRVTELFSAIEDCGVPVLAIPGNHDLNNPSAYRYEGSKAYPVESPDQRAFAEMYAGFGYGESIRHDPASFSYAYPLAGDLWVVMLDANTEAAPGSLGAQTLAWLEETLAEAEREDIAVVTVTHQNLLRHNAQFPYGYTLYNCDRVRELLTDYGVALNLSGHIHLQHISESGGLTEVATSSLSVSENHIGVLEIAADRSAGYHTRSADVAGYAAETGSEDENLLDYPEYGTAYFLAHSFRGAENLAADLGVSEEEAAQMNDAACRLNQLYFVGRVYEHREELLADPGIRLWLDHTDTRTGSYVRYVLEAEKKDENTLTLPALRTPAGTEEDAA